MGRPQTPLHTLKLRGSYRADRHGENHPEIPDEPMDVPAWVMGEAVEHWNEIAEMLSGMGIDSPFYSPALALLVNSLGWYIRLEEQVKSEGVTSMTDKGNAVVNPTWAARNKAWEQVMKALREFGMTPAAIRSVRKESPEEVNNDKSKFFNSA